MKMQRKIAMSATAFVAIMLTVGCTTPSATPEEPAATTTQEPEAPKSDASEGENDLRSPIWFTGELGVGEKIAEGSSDNWKVEVYQVATDTMDTDSREVDPDSRESLLPAGAPVVYLNVEYTSIGDTPMTMSELPTPRITTVDWKFLGGMPGVVSPDQYEKHGLSTDDTDYASMEQHEQTDAYLYAILPGETVSKATSVAYKANEEMSARVSFIPKLADGGADIDSEEIVELPFRVK